MPSDPSDPGNDVYFGRLGFSASAVVGRAVATIERLGATIVRANIPTEGWIGGPGTEMAILNRNPRPCYVCHQATDPFLGRCR